jgi:hypothetical protein
MNAWVSDMKFNQQLSVVRWKRIGIASVAGIAVVLAISTAYDTWRRRDGWCVRFYPDGSEKTIYGSDCQN